MKAMIVDDEALGAIQMRKGLEETKAFSSIMSFTDPVAARDYVKHHTLDVAFLDVKMPEISGISLAGSIHDADDKIQIVFITAYREYAAEAFALDGIDDYLLKPVEQDRLDKTVRRLIDRRARTGCNKSCD